MGINLEIFHILKIINVKYSALDCLKLQDAVFGFQYAGSIIVQEFVHFPGAFSSFADSPNNQALATAHIAGSEDLGDIAAIIFISCFYISPFIEIEAEVIDKSYMLRVYKAHGKQSDRYQQNHDDKETRLGERSEDEAGDCVRRGRQARAQG